EVRRPRGDGPPRRLRRHAREAAPARRRARAVGAPPRGRPQGDPRQHPGGRGPPRARRPGARRLRLQGHEARPALSVRPRARDGTLVEQARRSLNQGERERLYGEAQDLLAKEMVWIPIYNTMESVATRASVKGFGVHPVEYFLPLGKVWLDR